MTPDRSASERVYRRLLLLAPRRLRERHGREMTAMFAEAVGHARRTGLAAVVHTYARAVIDLAAAWPASTNTTAEENRTPSAW